MAISFSPRAGLPVVTLGVRLGSVVMVGPASAQTPWVAPEAEARQSDNIPIQGEASRFR